MPQLDINPVTNPGATYFNTATGGSLAPEKKKQNGKNGKNGQGGKNTSSNTTVATVSAPAKDTGKKGGKGGKGGKGDKGKPEKQAYNPLYEPFLTPKQIREQAKAFAAATEPTEAAVSQPYLAEQAGLQGLTGALSARLGDIAAQQTAGLQGFGGMYERLASGAQAAGQSAAAAAGAPTTIAAGGTPTVANEFARQAYAVTGYQPAAEITGQRLIGASMANLRKALVDRASRISADAAKYVQSMSDRELQRAISQESAVQNAARLNLAVGQQDWKQQYEAAKLAQGNEALRIRGQSLQLQVQKAANQYAAGTPKSVAAAQNTLMENASKYTALQKQPSGLYEYQIQVPTMDSMGNTTYKPQTITAKDQNTADQMAQQAGATGAAVQTGQAFTMVAPSRAQAMAKMIGILAPYMGQKRARAWVVARSTALGLDTLA